MKVAQYELQTLLGAGGMGEVWQAVDRTLQREVAIKRLPQSTAADPEFRARFLREARLAARLNHPHIATIFSVEEHESTLYLVMELVQGTALDRVLADGPLAPATAVEMMLQVASAIEEAHAHGIIHRDIKPENIMIAPNGVKVLDFGIARELAPLDGVRMTQAGMVMGTPNYMSPEQAQGLELNEQSDIFSLGAVLYEMLAGRAAFDPDSLIGVLVQVATKPHPPLDNVPPELAAVVDRCLQKKPAARFGSVAEMAQALEAAMEAKPKESGRPTLVLEAVHAGERALVADDDAVTRSILRALLEELGYGVDEAVDGSEAIRRLKHDRYALLITDLLMPRLDGWNVLDFIRGAASRRPAHVLVTSMMSDVTLGDADREIVQAVITKPITRTKLRQVLDAA